MGEAKEEAAGKEVARRCGIDHGDAACGHPRLFVSAPGHGPLGTQLHHSDVALTCQAGQRSLGRSLAREGQALLLIGKDDVHIVLHQMAEEVEVGPHHIGAGQVDAHPKSFAASHAESSLDQVVVLHQISLHMQQAVATQHLGKEV